MWMTVEKALLPDRQLQIRLLDVGRCGWSIDLKLERKQSDISCFQHKSASVYFNGCGKSTAAWIFLLPAVDFSELDILGDSVRLSTWSLVENSQSCHIFNITQSRYLWMVVEKALLPSFFFTASYRYFSRTRMRHRGSFGWSIDLKLGRKQSVLSYF